MSEEAPLTNEKIGEIKADIADALYEVEKKHHVVIELGNWKAETRRLHIPMTVNVLVHKPDGTIETPEAYAFKAYGANYGLLPSYLGRRFEFCGKEWKIIGLDEKARTKPVICLTEKPKLRLMKFTAQHIVKEMKRQDAKKVSAASNVVPIRKDPIDHEDW